MSDARHCPACDCRAEVKQTRQIKLGIKRYIQCPGCGEKWRTFEQRMDVMPQARRPAKPNIRRTMRQAIAIKRGCDVPPELEDEWKRIRRKGISPAETARMLGLKMKRRRL